MVVERKNPFLGWTLLSRDFVEDRWHSVRIASPFLADYRIIPRLSSSPLTHSVLQKGMTLKPIFQVDFRASLLLIGLTVGCGSEGPEVFPVHGTVRLNGQPLSDARVLFTPVSGGRPSAAITDLSGEYSLVYTDDLPGALPGEHLVSISTFRRGDPDQNIPPSPEQVPARYNVQSELRQQVSPDSETFDFDLTGSGNR